MDDITPAPESLHKLLEEAKPELLKFKLSKDDARRNVGRERVVELTEITLTSWAPLKDSLDQVFLPALAEQHKAELARLDTRAWVFYAADLAAEDVNSDVAKKAAAKLAEKVKAHDRKLMTWAIAVFGDDPIHAATLRDISRGSGKRDDAEDVQRLVALYSENWALAEQKQTEISKSYLDEADADAAKQLDYLRSRKRNAARRLAEAAYALWYRDYVELIDLGRYLTRADPDSLERFPGVQEERGAPSTASSEASAPIEEVEDEDEDDEEGQEEKDGNA